MDIITISCKNHIIYVNALWKQNADLSSVKERDAYSNHRDFNGLLRKHLGMDTTEFVRYYVSCHHIPCTSLVNNSV
jgi:hypothetical protein